ncbi:ABC transporter ATP-binding protein [Acidimangrovimonas sediminis]|uniref:ABC transporter ATP-binding protein n=1 Tax=Acidimangrovimonas sediminis TaxID=2056283 RepID=UPI000C801035|nr:ABC transporter ATP-binding protein [Acidimangrovimonas sediminis]
MPSSTDERGTPVGRAAPGSGAAVDRDAIGSSLRLRSVGKYFGGFHALEDISLDVQPGEFITLLGPSGSGKTTLLNMLAGFYGLDEGEILVDGRPIHHVPTHRRGFGMVFQSYALFPNMTVAQNVAFPLRMAGMDQSTAERRVAETLEIMRLGEQAAKLPTQMSGGQQQRVAIARAIVMRPKVVLMDEPLSALDRRLREQIQIEIRELHQTLGSTILFVTHDQGEALTMSDRIAVLDGGKLVQIAEPMELYRHPVNRFVASFVGESNLIEAEILERRGETLTLRSASGHVFHGRARHGASAGRATALLRPERVALSAQPVADGLPVRVTSALFLGEIQRIEAVSEAGEHLLIRCADTSCARLPSVGDTLWAGWGADDCWVLS